MNPEQFSLFLEEGTIIQCGQNRLLIGFGKRQGFSKTVKLTQPLFYSPDFFLKSNQPWFVHSHHCELSFDDLLQLLSMERNASLPSFEWVNAYSALFQEAFTDLQSQFSNGALVKAVPYVFERTPSTMTRTQLIQSLLSALKYAKSRPVHLYGSWDKTQGILGATPEILFRFNQDQILETMACAGTSPVHEGQCFKDLLNDPKEMDEHNLVKDDIFNSLKNFGQIKLEPTRIVQFQHIAHLITPIQVKLHNDIDFDTLVHALHPTPALGATPRQEGMKWLLRYQAQIDRRRFGAPFGFINQDERSGTCLVAIRNAQWDEQGIAIGAGCGVVAKSKVDQEWNEIKSKIQAIKAILSI